jgi:hypothetical protein
MKDRITTTLETLAGLALVRSGTAAGMVSFLFGRAGEDTTDGESSLHLQCPWRIVLNDKIVVASSDVFFPGDDREDIEEFDPDEETSLFETRISAWFDSGDAESRIVDGVRADALGGFLMLLRGGATLEAFPAHSMHGNYSEYWRLLRPGARHFVVSGSGIDEV